MPARPGSLRRLAATVVSCAVVAFLATGAPGCRRRPPNGQRAGVLAWERFSREHGGAWTVDWNPVSGTPRRISGSFLDVADDITTANAGAVALRLAGRFRDLLQTDPGSLALSGAEFLPAEPGARGRGTWYIVLRQMHGSVPVEGGLVRFIIRNQKLTTMGSDVFSGIDAPSAPGVALSRAVDTIRRDMGWNAPLQPVASQLVVWPDTRSAATRYRLVWRIVMPVVPVRAVPLQSTAPAPPSPAAAAAVPPRMQPAQWRYRVDAIDGSILERIDVTVAQTFSGHVTALARPLLPADPPAQVNIADMTVTLTQGTTTQTTQTDASTQGTPPWAAPSV